MAVNSTGWLPGAVTAAGSDLSRWFLVAAIAGLGTKTQLRELVAVGLKPVLLMVGETLFLAGLALALALGGVKAMRLILRIQEAAIPSRVVV